MRTNKLLSVAIVMLLALSGTSVFAQGTKGDSAADKKVVDREKSEGIEFLHDLNKAMELSAKDGRPVITYFTFDT